MLKTCSKCSAEHPATREYFQTKASRHGNRKVYVTSYCLDCVRTAARERARRQMSDPAFRACLVKATSKWKQKHGRDAEHAAARAKRRAKDAYQLRAFLQAIRSVAIHIEADQKAHSGVCWLWNKPGLSSGEQYAIRYRIDIEFNLRERLRRQITKARKRDGIGTLMRSAIIRDGESKAIRDALGYTVSDLRAHLERQFRDGMSWQRFSEIHIDHIKPQAMFDLADDAQWRQCWSLANLQPLWAKENLMKGAKFIVKDYGS